MNNPGPNITVDVDITNPGQFFACCGLLELADRLWPGAEAVGRFCPPRFARSRFEIFSHLKFGIFDLMKDLLKCSRIAVDPYQPIMGSDGKPVKDIKKIMPIMIGDPISLRLGWWLDELIGQQTRFKMWGAHQTSEGLINDMAQEICAAEMSDSTVLQSRKGMTGRIGLDTRSSWNALDEGFSPNDQKVLVDTYPATEFLAAIGLETFRPVRSVNGYVYASWSAPLQTVVARAVASCSVNIQGSTRYNFQIATRGKFKFFTKASVSERNTYDRD
jgi:CRISPR-associated protein Csx14